jgi:hypothetical protein
MGYMSWKGLVFAVISAIVAVVAFAKDRVGTGAFALVLAAALVGVSVAMARACPRRVKADPVSPPEN